MNWAQLKRNWIVKPVLHKYVTKRVKCIEEFRFWTQNRIYKWVIITRKVSEKDIHYVTKCDWSLLHFSHCTSFKDFSRRHTKLNVNTVTSNEIFVSQGNSPVFVGIPIYLISCSFKMYL